MDQVQNNDAVIIVGQIQKNPVEIVQVSKKRLDSGIFVHAAVFHLSGSKASGERGLCLSEDQWNQLIALIGAAKNVELPKPMKKIPAPPRKKPARKPAPPE